MVGETVAPVHLWLFGLKSLASKNMIIPVLLLMTSKGLPMVKRGIFLHSCNYEYAKSEK